MCHISTVSMLEWCRVSVRRESAARRGSGPERRRAAWFGGLDSNGLKRSFEEIEGRGV